ncbi:MAG: rhodanese-like domain-containing protein [Candidatus Brocadiales bacterium]
MRKWLVISCGVALIWGTFLLHTGGVSSSGLLLASDTQEGLEISADEAAESLVDGRFDVILDVRQPEEYEGMHIPGAILIPLNTLEEKARVQLDDPNAHILAYCGVGARSLEATKILRKMGYANVLTLKGGIILWKEKGYPVTE